MISVMSGNNYECAEQNVAVLTGESPDWVKVNRQPNTKSAFGEVTNQMLQGRGRHRDTTQVKVLSPEIFCKCRRSKLFIK